MTKQRLLILMIIILSGVSFAGAGCLDESAESVRLVLEDIYAEMGRPDMTKKIADKMDHLIFIRDSNKEPRLTPEMTLSGSPYKESITAIISCVENDIQRKLRFIWRPGQDLEIIDMDAVLKE